MAKHKQVENVRSGDQLDKGGRWDRVHGVSVDGNSVTISSDDQRDAEYMKGSTVKVV